MAGKPIPQTRNGRKTLPIEFVRAILSYDPETGILKWRMRPDVAPNGQRCGKIAGSKNKDGHIAVSLDGLRWVAHRLIWAIATGEWPPHDVDHINGIRDDNRWVNLRLATRQQNLQNAKLRSDNKCGHKWVFWSKRKKTWVAQVFDGRASHRLWPFKTAEDAHKAACQLATKLHGEFVRFS